jgi:hypothetical protein
VHAKVYRGPGGVAIGSANLSEKGLGTSGLVEAMTVVRDDDVLAAADAWLASLRVATGTISLARLVRDRARWAVIEEGPTRRSRGAPPVGLVGGVGRARDVTTAACSSMCSQTQNSR